MNFKKGYMVARKSYGEDIVFVIDKVIKRKNQIDYAILKGITIRIKADAPISDLVIASKDDIEKSLEAVERIIKKRAERRNELELAKVYNKKLKRYKEIIYTGKILHLDGDSNLSNLKNTVTWILLIGDNKK